MPSDVKPYLVPGTGTVKWDPWLLFADGEGWIPLPDEIDGWDPGTDLHIARRVLVDPVLFGSETGTRLAQVALSASWTSSTTGMADATGPFRVSDEGVGAIEARLVGERLAGVLSLRTTICLVQPSPQPSLGVAAVPGSVLVEDNRRVVLENQSSMFPTHQIDFARTSLPPTASWHLETSSDLAAPFFSAFRLLLNTRDGELVAAVVRGAKEKRQQTLMDDLEAGVAVLLLELAIYQREELMERAEWPPDSVGDVLSRILHSSGLHLGVPASAHDVSGFRTRLAAAVRDAGKGRVFR